MSRTWPRAAIRSILATVALCALGACAETKPTEPTDPSASVLLGGPSASAVKLVTCETDQTETTVGSVGILGGTIALGGTSVVIPQNAVLAPTTVELTIPASQYMEIRLTANGQQHFDFEAPVAVTIDYSRCLRRDILLKPLTVWYIDSDTKQPIYKVGGIDNKLTRSITFFTDHFSGYAIAF